MGDIVKLLISLILVIIHITSFLIAVIWRKKHFKKEIHSSKSGWFFLCFSTLSTCVLIFCIYFFKSEQPSSYGLFFCICAFFPFLSLKFLCYCIFIHDDEVIEKNLFSKTKISLKDPNCIIDSSGVFGNPTFITIISSDGSNQIQFNSRTVEGNTILFVRTCEKIRNKYRLEK